MDAAPMNVVIATKVWGMYFFMIVCFCSGQTYNKILKHQTNIMLVNMTAFVPAQMVYYIFFRPPLGGGIKINKNNAGGGGKTIVENVDRGVALEPQTANDERHA
jgi:hypothetical protein